MDDDMRITRIEPTPPSQRVMPVGRVGSRYRANTAGRKASPPAPVSKTFAQHLSEQMQAIPDTTKAP